MVRRLAAAAVALPLLLLPAAARGETGEIVIRYEHDAGPADRAASRERAGVRAQRGLDGPALQRVRTDDVAAALRRLADDPAVRWAAPPRTVRLRSIPNDPRFADQWPLRNTGRAFGLTLTPGADGRFVEAWADEPGSAGTRVGVVDSGYAVSNDLLQARWVNDGEVAGNGVDDDGNGYVDDRYGWSASSGDGDVADRDGHGTEVASIIGAQRGNGVAIAGAAQVTVVPARVFGDGETTTFDLVDSGSRYVANQGARVVNLSLGTLAPASRPVPDPWPWAADVEIFRDFPEVLFVVAAGNDGVHLPTSPELSFPCELPVANILCVGASTGADTRAGFSNHGVGSVDLMAPGTDIAAVGPGGGVARVNGTSFAAPLASAAAALVATRRPDLGGAGLRAATLDGAAVGALASSAAGGRRLDAQRALAFAGAVPRTAARPTVAGTPRAGAELIATAPAFDGPAGVLEYRWDRCRPSGACTRVSGAYDRRYTPAADDVGAQLRVTVVAHGPAGTTFSRSVPSAPVDGPPAATFPPGVFVAPPSAAPPVAAPGVASSTQVPAPARPGASASDAIVALPALLRLRGTNPVVRVRCVRPLGCRRTRVSLWRRGTLLARGRLELARGSGTVRLVATAAGRRLRGRWPGRVTVEVEVAGTLQRDLVRVRRT